MHAPHAVLLASWLRPPALPLKLIFRCWHMETVDEASTQNSGEQEINANIFGIDRFSDLNDPGPSEECGFHAPSYRATVVWLPHIPSNRWVARRSWVGGWPWLSLSACQHSTPYCSLNRRPDTIATTTTTTTAATATITSTI